MVVVRNRTSLFVRFREEARRLGPGRADEWRSGSFGDNAGLDYELLDVHLKPDFLQLHDQLVERLKSVEAALNTLTELQSKRLLPGFVDDDLADQEVLINNVTDEITREIHASEVAVRQLATTKKGSKLWENMQKTFASQVQDVSVRFRSQQKHYMKNLQKQRDMINSAVVKNEGQLVLLDDDPDRPQGGGFTQEQLVEIRAVDFHLEERNREIDAIAASIQDMATVMKDMSQLVVEQGTILDRVDYNVEETQFRTQEATEQLRRAERYQRKSFSFAIVMCLLFGCFIMAVLLLFKLIT